MSGGTGPSRMRRVVPRPRKSSLPCTRQRCNHCCMASIYASIYIYIYNLARSGKFSLLCTGQSCNHLLISINVFILTVQSYKSLFEDSKAGVGLLARSRFKSIYN